MNDAYPCKLRITRQVRVPVSTQVGPYVIVEWEEREQYLSFENVRVNVRLETNTAGYELGSGRVLDSQRFVIEASTKPQLVPHV